MNDRLDGATNALRPESCNAYSSSVLPLSCCRHSGRGHGPNVVGARGPARSEDWPRVAAPYPFPRPPSDPARSAAPGEPQRPRFSGDSPPRDNPAASFRVTAVAGVGLRRPLARSNHRSASWAAHPGGIRERVAGGPTVSDCGSACRERDTERAGPPGPARGLQRGFDAAMDRDAPSWRPDRGRQRRLDRERRPPGAIHDLRLPQRPASDDALVSRSRPGDHPIQPVRGIGGTLHHSRRGRRIAGASHRRLRTAAGDPGSQLRYRPGGDSVGGFSTR